MVSNLVRKTLEEDVAEPFLRQLEAILLSEGGCLVAQFNLDENVCRRAVFIYLYLVRKNNLGA